MRRTPGIFLVRVVFELHCPAAESARAIQNRVSSFAGGRFHTVIAEGFAEMARNPQTLLFRRVELDIGKISLSRLEDELAARILMRLREWVRGRTSSPALPGSLGNPDEVSFANPARQSHGRSRGNNSTIRGLNAAVKAALQEPADWSEFMAALRDNHALRRRLADEVSPKLLQSLIHSMVPGHGTWIGDFAETVLALHEQMPLATTNSHSFRRTLWECIFSALARSQQPGFEQRSFVNQVLTLMAAHYSRPLSAVIADLALALQGDSSLAAKSATVVPFLSELAAGKVREPAHVPARERDGTMDAAATRTAGISQALNSLEMFLEWGALPWISSSAPGRPLETELLDLLAASPEEVCALVHRLAETATGRKRIAREFSESAVKGLLGVVAPVASPWMIAQVVELRRLHAERPMLDLSNRDFAHLLWELCLEHLAESRWQDLSPRSCLHHLLLQLAARNKTSYARLLADVAMRRETEPRTSRLDDSLEQATGMERAILSLLDESMTGLTLHRPEVARFLVKPAFRQTYSDMDVLAYWLRWRRLPPWNQSTDAAEIAQRIGPLLRELPHEIIVSADRPSDQKASATAALTHSRQAADLSPSEQIKNWLRHGIWPAAVSHPEGSQLRTWLENQSDSDWKAALQHCGPREPVLQRIIHQLSSSCSARITRLLAAEAASVATQYLHSLESAGQQIRSMQKPLWIEHARRYMLAGLLREFSKPAGRTISISDLAGSTMLALALRFRVPYERILDCVAGNNCGQQAVQQICRSLRRDLEEERETAGHEETTEPITGKHVAGTDPPLLGAPASSIEVLSKAAESPVRFFRTQPSAESISQDVGCPSDTAQDTLDAHQSQGTEPVSAGQYQLDAASMDDQLRRRLDALAHFLRTGALPRSAEEMVGQSSHEWFALLLEKHAFMVVETLRSIIPGNSGVLARLMRYAATRQLARIVRTAAPEFSGLVLVCINAGREVGKEADISLAAKPSTAASIHWKVALGLVLDGPPGSLSATGFLGEFTRQASQQLGTPLADYCGILLRISRRRAHPGNGFVALADMLEQSQAAVPGKGHSEVTIKPEPEKAAPRLERPSSSEITKSTSSSWESLGPEQPLVGPEKVGTTRLPGLPRASADTVAQNQPAPALDATAELDMDESGPLDSTSVSRDNGTLRRLDSLLRYGELPGAVSEEERNKFMQALTAELGKKPAEYRQYFLETAAHELERKRMAAFLPLHVQAVLWPLILDADHAEATLCRDLLNGTMEADSPANATERCRRIVVEELLHAATRPRRRRWDAAAYLRTAVLRLAKELNIRASGLAERMRTTVSRMPEEIQTKTRPLVDRLERETAVVPTLPLRSIIEPAMPRLRKPVKDHVSRELPAGEAFHVGNCGAVLLWPFLSRYYQSLGLVAKNVFRDQHAQNHAIHLLQYVVTGKLGTPEHELLLNKILCGACPDEPLEAPSPLTEPEKALSEQLLRGVLQNWEKLRNTSIEGLRMSFLLREGKLLRKNDDWSLVVSAKSYDVLLDSLPWRFSLVRLPWMKTLLHVKWR